MVHKGIEEAIRAADPFGVQYELEIAVEADGVAWQCGLLRQNKSDGY